MRTHSVAGIRTNLFIIGFASLLVLFCGAGMASSFPFRAISPGDPLPALTFKHISDGSTLSLASLRGNPFAVVFWGADIDVKKERSLKTMLEMEQMMPFLEERGVRVLLVNAQGDGMDVIREVAGGLGGKIPVYLDENRKAYSDLGIFVVPSVILADRDGKVAAGLGFSHDFSERLRGEVQIMLGEKSREQVEQELRPRMVEKSVEEKQSTRHLNMAMVMMKRGQIDSAVNELQKALEIEPGMAEAHGQLGCLYLEQGRLEEAKKALDRSYDLDPDYLPANICDARIMAAEGRMDEAVGDLQALLFRNARNPELHYALGELYEKQEKFAQAAEAYRKAFELVARQVEFE
ncbi:MAG TPA: tetratricopeptide repeat protein [Desulfobacteraceae bacterium]|nr:tetratricopeptide repeat protein [Desulfobacteraceae bacterium]